MAFSSICCYVQATMRSRSICVAQLSCVWLPQLQNNNQIVLMKLPDTNIYLRECFLPILVERLFHMGANVPGYLFSKYLIILAIGQPFLVYSSRKIRLR